MAAVGPEHFLSHGEARRFYDRFGRELDWQNIYEDRAIDFLVAHAAALGPRRRALPRELDVVAVAHGSGAS